MAPSVSLSARVSPQVRDRLAAEAGARGLPLATYAAQLLSGAAPDPSRPGDGDVQNEVECVFSGLPPEAGLRKQVALALARTVEEGGTAGIAAGRELLMQVHVAESLFEPECDEGDLDVEAALDAAGLRDER